MDRRQKKTKDAIIAAFIGLLKKKSYEKVSVKDIIEAADVGRSTFYDHFETKDELVRQICNELFAHIFAIHVKACSTHNFSQLPSTTRNNLAHIFYHIRDKRDYYMGILQYDKGNLFLRYFREYMLQQVKLTLDLQQQPALSRVPEDFIVNHIANGLMGAIQWWLQQNMQQSPEAVAEYFAALTNPAIVEFKISE